MSTSKTPTKMTAQYRHKMGGQAGSGGVLLTHRNPRHVEACGEINDPHLERGRRQGHDAWAFGGWSCEFY